MRQRLADSEVLRERNFRLLLSAEAVSVLGDRVVPIALAFAVLDLGGDAGDVGFVLAARTLPLVACLLFGGVIADRLPRRAVMVAADIARCATQGLLAALLLTDAAAIGTIAGLAALTGAATGFFSPASLALVPAIVAPRLLQQANGIRATVTSGGEFIGPAVGGLLIAVASPGWALAADAATFAISAVLLTRLVVPGRVRSAATRMTRDLADGWRAFASRRWVWSVVAGAAIGNLAWGAWSVLGPVIAERRLGGAGAWGTVLALMGAGALIGSAVAIRTTPRRPLLWTVGGYGIAFWLPLAALAAGASVVAIACAAFVSGAAIMLGNTIWETALQRHVPDDTLSRVTAYDWFGSLAFYPLGVAMWGPVAGVVGVSTALWAAAAITFIVWAAVLALPDVRALPAEPPR